MENSNKKNLLFFQASSMIDLYSELDTWQKKNEKRFLSLNIHQEGNGFSCIALTNPSEVIICDGGGGRYARVGGGNLYTSPSNF